LFPRSALVVETGSFKSKYHLLSSCASFTWFFHQGGSIRGLALFGQARH